VNQERRLRTYLLSCLASKVDVIKLQDVVKAVVHFNKMDTIDMEISDFQSVNVLAKKVLESVTEIEEQGLF
jgi:hypothetical protein